jgi:NADPH:quinone reductase-like Zn-dependent oxidoreductase
MKAAVHTRYGGPDVVEIKEVAKPEPDEAEVLVRIHATTVNRTDCGMRTPYPALARLFIGLFKPKHSILGLDFAGVVEDVGENVAAFKAGDRVFGLSPSTYGAHAEYLCVREDGPLATMPEGVDFAFPWATKAFVESLRDRIEAGEYRAVIDRRYALDEIVEAYRHLDREQKVGNVLIDVASDQR